MEKEAVQIVIDKLGALATKLGVSAEYMFGLYVKQAHISVFTTSAGLCLSFLILCGLGYWLFRRRNVMFDAKHDGEAIPFVVIGVISVIVFIIAIIECPSKIVTCLYNPEYWALNKILNIIN